MSGGAPLSARAASITTWPTYHLDTSRTGNDAVDPAIPSVVSNWSSPALDGNVYAEPLIVGGNVLVATENDSVYALNTSNGTIAWSVNLATPLGFTAVPQSQLSCGNVNPTVGITGTPVADATNGILYVVAFMWKSPDKTTFHYELFALDLNNKGAVLWHETIAPAAGAGLPAFNPDIQGQRGALGLSNGNVYIPFGGRFGDCGDYRGWVVGAPVSGPPNAPFSWELPSPDSGGGIWASPGMAIDGSGNIFVATGNTFSSGSFDYGESVIKLPPNLAPSPANSFDYFAPSNWSYLDSNDIDLGSVAPALLGNGLLFQIGKYGVGFLLNTSSLGGSNHSTPRFSARVCSATNDAAFGGTAYMAPYLFVPCSDRLVAAIVNSGASPSFSIAWTGPGVNNATSPIVADGLVWTIDTDGTVRAMDPATGWQRFRANVGTAMHFATPASAGGQVFVAGGNTVHAYGPPPATPNTYYFAEGFTATGFSESLDLLMPNHSGTATIAYTTDAGPVNVSVPLTAGKVTIEHVNTDVGAGHEVSAKVTLPFPGVVERSLNFNTASWHGSTDQVGVNAPSTEWNFAEGSTLNAFSEYLTLQNPASSPAHVDLHYFTDRNASPVKSLTLPATSRTTIEVMSGDLSNNGACTPGAGGSCGVGRGITGVSVSVVADQPIIAERPFYVNGYDFGSGVIKDGHDDFGANQPALTWNFAEGNTLSGFYEYVTLENPNQGPTTVDLNYYTDTGAHPTKTLVLGAATRVTFLVSNGNLSSTASCNWSTCGVGPGVVGVSLQVSSHSLPIVVERPMYMNHDFGTGMVNGAHVVMGANGLGTLFGFSAATTATGENPYLTIQNPNASAATVTITYYESSSQVQKVVGVGANSRHTVLVFQTAEGVGAGVAPLGIVVSSTLPVLVEKPTYSSNASTYGASDTLGATSSGF